MHTSHHREKPDVVLIGRKLPDNENLGLGYLAAALLKEGFSAEMWTFNTWADMESVCRRVLETGPSLVGIALPDGGSSFLPLGMGGFLRRRGFKGHITSGGGFATLARHWLLRRYGWLDSVVRFAGEAPLILLVRDVTQNGGASVESLPGITTIKGDGPPSPVMNTTQLEIFPEHGDLPEILGHPMAHIAATRGCPGRCAYCGPAALQTTEREEGLRAGFSARELVCAGVGSIRRRNLENLCDEMAGLWHEKKVRYFYFVDEHLLPRKEEEAVEFLRTWKKELRHRGVKELGLGGMLRMDFITPSIIKAFVEVGLVRCFAGIEFASDEEAKMFGRSTHVSRGLDIMAGFEELGVATICNIMLVHPYSTIETLYHGIKFLEKIEKGTFEATQMQVYHGTKLFERIHKEGRLTGNPLKYGYTHRDGSVTRFAEIFSRLRGEAFRNFSISFHVHDVWLAISLAGRLHPNICLDDFRDKAHQATRELNRLRVRTYLRALEFALSDMGFFECDELVRETRGAIVRLQRKMEMISQSLIGRLSRPGKIYSPMKTAAAFTLKFCIAGASLTGCYRSSGKEADATQERDLLVEEPVHEIEDSHDQAEEPQACTPVDVEAKKEEIRETAIGAEPCLSMSIGYHPDWIPPLSVSYPEGNEMMYCEAMDERIQNLLAEVREAIQSLDLRCFNDDYLFIEGRDAIEMNEMENAARTRCPGAFVYPEDWYRVVIMVDSAGKVSDVLVRDPLLPPSQESIECIKNALQGLTFPCLASYQICPEYVFIE